MAGHQSTINLKISVKTEVQAKQPPLTTQDQVVCGMSQHDMRDPFPMSENANHMYLLAMYNCRIPKGLGRVLLSRK